MKQQQTAKSQYVCTACGFDRVWDYCEGIMPVMCGGFLMVYGLQSFYPQPAYFYGYVAAAAFLVSAFLKVPKEFARLYGKI